MNGRKVLFAALTPFLLAAGCGDGPSRDETALPPDAIVRVDERVLTEARLEILLPAGEKTPVSALEKTDRVRQWVEIELLAGEAVRRGLHNDPRIKARLESLEREYLADHLAFLELRERIEVTEREVEEHFEEIRDQYIHEYRVSHIMVNTHEEALLVLDLLEKKSFARVANSHSVDPVARRGGDLGYLTKGNMIPAFETVIFEMAPGEVSGTVQSDFGFHVIKLVGMREAQVKVALADVREKILNGLVMRRREAAYRALIDRLNERAEVEYISGEYAKYIDPADTSAADTTKELER